MVIMSLDYVKCPSYCDKYVNYYYYHHHHHHHHHHRRRRVKGGCVFNSVGLFVSNITQNVMNRLQ